MGNRFLRDAILRSDRICELPDAAQLLFYKLISVVDDFGCFDGRERVIAITAYPLAHREIAQDLLLLQQAEAIVRYLNAGKPFIAVMQWGEVTRNYRRKWPAPPVMNDLADLKYRVPFGNVQEQFHNPRGCDLVSILLDIHGRPVQPQPPEWRRIDTDMMPIASITLDGEAKPRKDRPQRSTVQRSVDAAGATQHSTRTVDAARDTQRERSVAPAAQHTQIDARPPSSLRAVEPSNTAPPQPSSEAAQPDTQHERSTAPAATATTNGKVELTDSGEWRGVSESQRLRWQGMFADLSIPDQLDRAGAWLLAHPDERASYTSTGTLDAFLIRWLLREARGTGKTA